MVCVAIPNHKKRDLVHLLDSANYNLKGWVQCFSMQVVMNKCFYLNLKKNLVQIHLVVPRNMQKMHTLILKNDITEPKTRLL